MSKRQQKRVLPLARSGGIRPALLRSRASLFPRPPPASSMPAADVAARTALIGLFGLALLYTLHLAKAILLPVVLAVLLALVLSPWVTLLWRRGAPRPLGAAVVVLALLGTVTAGVVQLADPANAWIARAPAVMRDLEYKLVGVKRSVAVMNQAAQKVEEIANAGDASPRPKVAVKEPGFTGRLLAATPGAIISAGTVLVLLYFLLAHGNLCLRNLVGATHQFGKRRRTIVMLRAVRQELVNYLMTIVCINLALGAATAGVLHLAGMPNPVLWGVMAGVFNFVPYLGPALSLSVIGVVAVLSFDEVWRMLLPPCLFAVLTVIEGQFLVPHVVGRRFTLNPVVILLSTMLWGWMWGIPGVLIAVPLLVALKIVCDHADGLKPLGMLVSGAGGRDGPIAPALPTSDKPAPHPAVVRES
ncbi:MAG: AI-2E family transporter [Betaproteobacteria bacterium HGW-Betaproteobacteria-14]|nr:MAG: AI-2E family transporter [Betaproteobacteria bacterium HGW-Betaproteobacteria-14]